MTFCQLLLPKLGLLSTKLPFTKVTVCVSYSTSSCHRARAHFPGKCLLISHPATQEALYKDVILSLMAGSKVLGFDTEAKPSFLSGSRRHNPPCLVQLASEEVCVIWRLQIKGESCNYVGTNFPPLLRRILTSKDVLKVNT